jgi:hypothetical protein
LNASSEKEKPLELPAQRLFVSRISGMKKWPHEILHRRKNHLGIEKNETQDDFADSRSGENIGASETA